MRSAARWARVSRVSKRILKEPEREELLLCCEYASNHPLMEPTLEIIAEPRRSINLDLDTARGPRTTDEEERLPC
jgi:hypothetical protein